MTTLELFWIASAGGASLFFVAGVLVAHRASSRSAVPAELGWAPPDWPVAGIESPAAPAERDAVAPVTQVDELSREVAARSARESALEAELAAARDHAARLDAHIGARQARMAELSRELASRRNRVAELEADQTARAQRVGELEADQTARAQRVGELETELAAANAQAADRAAELRDRGGELEVLRGRLRDLEAMHADYVRLRTQRDETEYLRSEIARLKGRLNAARSRPAPAPKIQPPAGAGADLSLADALSRAVGRLLDDTVSTAVVADRAGFAVTATDERGASLAVYATLLADAADRAHTFVDAGPVHRIAVVDGDDLRVSIWPFEVDGERLSLITMSEEAPPVARVDQVVGELVSLLGHTPTSAAG